MHPSSSFTHFLQIGGATGRVGDPSGRLTERTQADIRQVEDNVVKLTENIQFFFARALEYAQSRLQEYGSPVPPLIAPSVLSNLTWHEKFTMLDFLRDVGKRVRVNTMLNRERYINSPYFLSYLLILPFSVRARLESQQGLSFTEFTYQLLQAYDFYYLHTFHSCNIQVGGSDQWGNILAGLELIGRYETQAVSSTPEPSAYGLTTPLLTTSTGEKFGKSVGNAVWLNPQLTSIFDFYQVYAIQFLAFTFTDAIFKISTF
jgi:tyrosyl-tRNA synthetase